MKKIFLFIGALGFLGQTAFAADTLKCVPGYAAPTAEELAFDNVLQFDASGAVLANAVNALGPIIDRVKYSADPLAEAEAARDFSHDFTEIAFVLLKQAENALDKACKAKRDAEKTTALFQLQLKVQGLMQMSLVVNQYVHGGQPGGMRGTIGVALMDPTGSQATMIARGEGLLRVRQYYYILYKAGMLSSMTEAAMGLKDTTIDAFKRDTVAERSRLIQAFLDSKKDYSAQDLNSDQSRLVRSIDFVLSDLN
jgi:hypothetical protein